MFEKCKRCALPEILNTIRTNKAIGQAALANLRLAESPTEAEPYKEVVNSSHITLEKANQDLDNFLKMWGYCDDCHLK